MALSTSLAQLLEVAFLQELLVLATFAFSFILWRRLKAPIGSSGTKPKDGFVESVVKEDFTVEQVNTSIGLPSVEHAQSAEKEMQTLFATGEFTRALKLYRRCERNGLEALFSEELFSSLVQSGIRVNKLDVVERTLRSMKRINLKPSLEFWQLTMKMLSSRKHFALCLVAYSVFESQIPVDKVIFSCLINAALDDKTQTKSRIVELLKRYNQAALEPKDHVLHFRCYVQLSRGKEARELFRRLAPQVTDLMLNLSLQACVKQKDPEAAFQLLLEAKEIEKRYQLTDRLVDLVSYNTVMKGFAATKSQSKCLDCLKDLIEAGLQPNDISLASLMEATSSKDQSRVANEIGDFVLQNLSKDLKPHLCKSFLRGLVRTGHISKSLALYEAMKQQKVPIADIAIFSVLIKALVDQRDSTKAFELVEDLKAQGLQLDDMLLTHLLEACRQECNYKLGKKFYQDALDSGVIPSDVTLVTLLKLLGSCDASEEAFQVVRTWEELYQRRPSVIHYTCLMKGCFRSKNYELAWASYQLMLENQIRPDDTTISTMISGMMQGQQWEKVLLLAQQMPRPALQLAIQKAPEPHLTALKAILKTSQS